MKNCPCCDSKNIRKDFDYPKTIRCCNKCGADFTTDGDILLDPRTYEPKNIGTQRSPFGIGS